MRCERGKEQKDVRFILPLSIMVPIFPLGCFPKLFLNESDPDDQRSVRDGNEDTAVVEA